MGRSPFVRLSVSASDERDRPKWTHTGTGHERLRHGAAKESNLPSEGLPRRHGFEDQSPAPVEGRDVRGRSPKMTFGTRSCCDCFWEFWEAPTRACTCAPPGKRRGDAAFSASNTAHLVPR